MASLSTSRETLKLLRTKVIGSYIMMPSKVAFYKLYVTGCEHFNFRRQAIYEASFITTITERHLWNSLNYIFLNFFLTASSYQALHCTTWSSWFAVQFIFHLFYCFYVNRKLKIS